MYTLRVGNDVHAVLEGVFLAVEGQNLLTVAGKSHRQIARQLVRIEDVQRATEIEGNKIGDINER